MSLEDRRQTGTGFWLRLDNAAKIYPAIKNQELTSVIRISVELKERIRARPFSEAILATERRFPYYKMKLKQGFFWYFLEYENIPVKVKADSDIPCRAFQEDELMYRILVKENRVSVEFSHILTDGSGAFEFLKTLIFSYLERCGYNLPEGIPYYHPDETVSEGEYEDAFNRFFERTRSPLIPMSKAFHLPFQLRPKPRFNLLMGILPSDEIHKAAKLHSVSMTVYLIAVYLQALQEVYFELPAGIKRKSKKLVRIEVPVNLRRIFSTKTMRNFSLYVLPEIDLRLGRYSFEELIKIVYHQMQLQTDKKLINKMISRNVGGEKNLLIRGTPLVIKSIILSRLFAQGTDKYSGVLTNLGKVDFTPEINKYIKRFIFIPPPASKKLKVNCGVIGFESEIILVFGNISTSKSLEKHFFTFLTGQGIPVKIEKY